MIISPIFFLYNEHRQLFPCLLNFRPRLRSQTNQETIGNYLLQGKFPKQRDKLHLKEILDTLHDNVVLGPDKTVHVDGHNSGLDSI
jgi:hypothetical protein